MNRSFRKVLAESHVAAVAIAVLLAWSLHYGFLALWVPLFRVIAYVFTAVAILDFPYVSPGFNAKDRFDLILACEYLYVTVISLSAAWILSQWVYDTGPFRCLSKYREKIERAERA